MRKHALFLVYLTVTFACGPAVSTTGAEQSATTHGSSATGAWAATSSLSQGSATSTGADPDPASTTGESSNTQVDILFVIDNSGSMAGRQQTLAHALVGFGAQLLELQWDVQIMFTTTDFGSPLCSPFEPKGYMPARGAPVATPCTGRLDDFTSLSGTVQPETCTAACMPGSRVGPVYDPFVAFDTFNANVPELLPAADVDGDGMPDAPFARALACLAPTGLNGCGYESPLESMRTALHGTTPWNLAERPFVRPEASIVAIVLLTDEADCSVEDIPAILGPQYHELNPDTGAPQATSALCWNAGTECGLPNAMGVFASCTSASRSPLHSVERYTDFLTGYLRDELGKEVVMLGIVGVPQKTPAGGGVEDLIYRQWQDGQYPKGDILADDFANGVTAADKQFQLGIGPGCTDVDGGGQAIPPARLLEVCQALDLGPEASATRCCMESICDADYSQALACLTGLIDNAS